MKIGFVGLGKLGLPVALAVESKGHDVIGYDISENVKNIIEAKKIPYKEIWAQDYLDKSNNVKILLFSELKCSALVISENCSAKDSFTFSKHPFLKSIDPDYNIFNLTESIKAQIDGLLNKTLDPIDVANEWSNLHLNFIVCIVIEYIIFNCKDAVYKPLDQSLDQYYKKLVDIYTKIPLIKKNISLNINTKYLLNNLTIELAS